MEHIDATFDLFRNTNFKYSERVILLYIAYALDKDASRDPRGIQLSYRRLSDELRTGSSNIYRVLKLLRDRGYLESTGTGRPNGALAAHWRLAFFTRPELAV